MTLARFRTFKKSEVAAKLFHLVAAHPLTPSQGSMSSLVSGYVGAPGSRRPGGAYLTCLGLQTLSESVLNEIKLEGEHVVFAGKSLVCGEQVKSRIRTS